MSPLTSDALARLAARAPDEPRATNGGDTSWDARLMRDTITGELNAVGIELGHEKAGRDGARLWPLSRCPYSDDHDDSAAFLVQYPSGYCLPFCHHDRCRGKRLLDAPGVFARTLAIRPLVSGPMGTAGGESKTRNDAEHEHSDPTTPGIAFQPLDLAALYALPAPDVTYLVDGILPLGSLCLLSAREKGGKGYLTIDLCASVAAGETFLDRAVMAGPMIYCAAEENIRDVRQRVRNRVGDTTDIPLYVLPLDGSTEDVLDLGKPETVARLEMMILEIEPAGIVIDVLREVHRGKEDSSDEMAPLIKPLREMAHRHNVTIILNHHMSKAGGFRGSTAIRAATDLEWAFTRSDDDTSMNGTLRVDGRHGPRETFAIRFDPDTARWSPTNAVALPETTLRGRILAAIQAANDWVTPDGLATATGASLKTIQNELSRMNRESPAPYAITGTGTRNDPRRYHTLNPTILGGGQVDHSDSSHSQSLGEREQRNNPDSSGMNPGTIPSPRPIRTCVQCGALVSGPGMYCERHSQPLAPTGTDGTREY